MWRTTSCRPALGMPKGLTQSEILRQNAGLASMWMSAQAVGGHPSNPRFLASVALLAFLGNLAIAQQTSGLTGNFVAFKDAFFCFGIGVMLAASSSTHLKEAEGNTGRRLRAIGIGKVVGALVCFAVGKTVARTR
jgi:hypothetical protein